VGWFGDAMASAMAMIFSLDVELYRIIGLSLQVTLSAVFIAAAIGIPAGIALGMTRFPGKGVLVGLFNTLMGLPPVVAGLVVFLMLSRRGVFGEAQLLFTPTAMIIAQTLLVTPILVALSQATVVGLDPLLPDVARTLGARRWQVALVVVHEARYGLMAAVTAGFGRAIAEVGAVLMVGGNIKDSTRTMTTAITMQTTMGDYDMALALGMVLLMLAAIMNGIFYLIQRGSNA